MATISIKKEWQNTPYLRAGDLASQKEVKEEDTFSLFQSLKFDEDRLIEQKENLKALLNQLEDKAKEKVEKRKSKVEILKSEVADIKLKCEKLQSWINTDSELENSQTER